LPTASSKKEEKNNVIRRNKCDKITKYKNYVKGMEGS
jgi:hypothetical protein